MSILKFASQILLAVIFSTILGTANGENAKIAPLVSGLGNHSYPINNCKSEAQTYFDQGLRLYYGFRFPESLASFQQASALDPSCAMALWGEALAIGPNPNSRYLGFPDDPKSAGLVAIEKADQLLEHATPKERELIQALGLRFARNRPRGERDLAYREAMASISAKYPDDAEILTLYCEALMTESAWDYWTPDGKPRSGTTKAMLALNTALKINENHPGANHLFIHLLEDSLTPEIALPHAERLADSMPNVGHMVHMPTHIHIRTGQYQKAIDLNQQSIEAAATLVNSWGEHSLPMGVPSLSSSDRTHAGHALDFIHLASVLQGNFGAAMKHAYALSESVETKLHAFGGFQRRFVKPMLTLRRFSRWDEILSLTPIENAPSLVSGLYLFARGSAMLHTEDIAGARNALRKLFLLVESPETAKQRSWVNNVDVLLRIASQVLSAEIDIKNKQYARAIASYEDAIRLEDGLNYMEPPEWGHPVRQELGALLLRLNRPREAETVFWEDLRRNPENGWSLHGVWQSLLAQGKGAEAKQVESRFFAAWQSSDTKLENGRALSP
ncbi:MAG: hypothetical protein AAF387_08310 [Pseudomonadota bacterium]